MTGSDVSVRKRAFTNCLRPLSPIPARRLGGAAGAAVGASVPRPLTLSPSMGKGGTLPLQLPQNSSISLEPRAVSARAFQPTHPLPIIGMGRGEDTNRRRWPLRLAGIPFAGTAARLPQVFDATAKDAQVLDRTALFREHRRSIRCLQMPIFTPRILLQQIAPARS